MNKPESVLENEKVKILWVFEIQTNPFISARRPDLVLINKKKGICHQVDFAVLVDQKGKIKESEKTDKYLNIA